VEHEMSNNASIAETNELGSVVLRMAIDCWRFARVYQRLVLKLNADEQVKFFSQYRYFLKQLEDNMSAVGLRLVNLEGQPFDPGMAASAINLADFSSQDKLCVEQMLEPTIMDDNGIVKMGTVILRKVE